MPIGRKMQPDATSLDYRPGHSVTMKLINFGSALNVFQQSFTSCKFMRKIQVPSDSFY